MKSTRIAQALSLAVAPLALAAHAQGQLVTHEPVFVDRANLRCSYLEIGPSMTLNAVVAGADAYGFALYAQVGLHGRFDPARAILMAVGSTTPDGTGEIDVTLPPKIAFPASFGVQIFALYPSSHGGARLSEPVPFLLNPKPLETLDFDWGGGGEPLPAGLPISDQWAAMGLSISATNATAGHPDMALLFDSSSPTGGDSDLLTPGPGLFNDRAYGKVLVIAEDAVDVDGDGLVDDPDDERFGGSIVFDFGRPVLLDTIAFIDVDEYESVAVAGRRGPAVVQDYLVHGMGDNSVARVGFAANPITRLEVVFNGSGGIGELTFSPCPDVVSFDRTLTGIPLGMVAGERVDTQFAGALGFQVQALSATSRAILFDTANPTGDDSDLATPGYHPTNTKAYEQILILAENVVDANGDGIVDVPDDDRAGGMLAFEFEYDVIFESATVIDIDFDEGGSFFEAFDEGGMSLGTWPLAILGDNSVQTVFAGIAGTRRIELHLTGSGGLAEFLFCRDDDPPAPQ